VRRHKSVQTAGTTATGKNHKLLMVWGKEYDDTRVANNINRGSFMRASIPLVIGAAIFLAACGNSKSLSGTYVIQNGVTGMLDSMTFQSSGAVDVATAMGVEHTTYKLSGDEVTMDLPSPPLPLTFKVDNVGCLVMFIASITPNGAPVTFCKKP
jgi:hypothetical protein